MAYSALTMLFLAFFYKYLPETKNLPLEAITYAFHDDNWGKTVFFGGNNGNNGGISDGGSNRYSEGREKDRGKYDGDNGDDGDDSDSDSEFNSGTLHSSAAMEALLKSKYFESTDSGSSVGGSR